MTAIEEVVRGRVYFIHEPDRTWGFIETSNHEQVFFHIRDCHGQEMPEDFAIVEFHVVPHPGKRKRRAVKVRMVQVAAA
jgi:cold shock CspA family protein